MILLVWQGALMVVSLKALLCLATQCVLCPEKKRKKGFLGTSGLSAVCSFISINCKITGRCALFH